MGAEVVWGAARRVAVRDRPEGGACGATADGDGLVAEGVPGGGETVTVGTLGVVVVVGRVPVGTLGTVVVRVGTFTVETLRTGRATVGTLTEGGLSGVVAPDALTAPIPTPVATPNASPNKMGAAARLRLAISPRRPGAPLVQTDRGPARRARQLELVHQQGDVGETTAGLFQRVGELRRELKLAAVRD